MARKVEVGGSVVREWAKSEAGQEFMTAWAAEKEGREVPTVGLRGKFSDTLVELFHKANKGQKYVTGHVPTRKITGTRVTESGRKVPATVTATIPEVREWAKAQEGFTVGDKGRISAEVFAAFAARPKS